MKTERISGLWSKGISLLRSDILNDLDASFYALDLKRETRNHVKFRTAHFANDFNVTIKVDSFWSVCTREMISYVTFLVTLDCAENSSTRLFTSKTAVRLKLLMCPIEVKQLSICSFLNFFSPESAVNMHKLVYIVRNKSACYFSFSVQFTKNASQSLLRVVNQNISVITTLFIFAFRTLTLLNFTCLAFLTL
jgi:hypothetical protein